MDWLMPHFRLTIALLPVVLITFVSGERVFAQLGRSVPQSTYGSEGGSLTSPGPTLTPNPGLSGAESAPSPRSQPPIPFQAPEAPSLTPESPQIPGITPSPRERRFERAPARSFETPRATTSPRERLLQRGCGQGFETPGITLPPGERRFERAPARSVDRLDREPSARSVDRLDREPSARSVDRLDREPNGRLPEAGAVPARSPIEQMFTGDPLEPRVSRDLCQFGYDLFGGPDSTFAPVDDAPVGGGYVLGPGDVLQLYLWGMVNNALTLQVNRQGEIFVPRIGTIPVWGRPLGEVRQLIHEQLSRQFSGFRMSLNLSEPRSIQVFIVGEVTRPGVYTVSPVSTIINALFVAGGPTKLGSLRIIRLIRNNRTIGTLDMYDFLLRGNRARDIRLESGDTVFVAPIGPVVGIAGNVKRPAIYELNGPTRITDLFQMAGGVPPTGYLQRVQIERVKPHTEKLVLDLQLNDLKNGRRTTNNPVLEDGDLVKIFPIDTRIYNAVFLEGSVRRPGEYELKNGMRLGDLLSPAEVLPEAYINRVEVIRTYPNFTRKILAADLQKLWEGDQPQNLPLEPGDRIVISSESRSLGEVMLQGELKRPGIYPIVQGERLSSVLKRAGGFTEEAYPKGAVFIREKLRRQQQEELERFIKTQEEALINESARSAAGSLELAGSAKEESALQQQTLQQRRQLLDLLKSKVVLGRLVVKVDSPERIEGTPSDIPLEDGDQLMVPKQPSSVLVIGSVRNPAAVVYEDGRDVEYYLNRAGGLNKEADKDEIHVVKADGSATAGFLKLRKVEAGDIIVAPAKVDAKVRTLPTVKDIATILGQFALTAGVLGALF
jgi:polysaccharide biosynthesis/export protein